MLPASWYSPIFRTLTPTATVLSLLQLGPTMPSSKVNATVHHIVGFTSAGAALFGSLAGLQHAVSSEDWVLAAITLENIVSLVWAIIFAETKTRDGLRAHARMMHLHLYLLVLLSTYSSSYSFTRVAAGAASTGLCVLMLSRELFRLPVLTDLHRKLFEPKDGALYQSQRT